MTTKSLASKDKKEVATVPNYGVAEVGESLYKPTPYVVFASSRSQKYPEMLRSIPDLQEGDPVLVTVPPEKLNPFRFYLVQAFQHFSVLDNDGQIVKTTLDPNAAKESKEWKEHIEACLLVVTPAKIVPARCTFKTTKVNAARAAVNALREASTEEWAKKSAEHKESLAVPHPWGRFTATVTLKRGTARSSGNKYIAADAFITPTGLADWKPLAESFKADAFRVDAEAAFDAFRRRVSELKASAK